MKIPDVNVLLYAHNLDSPNYSLASGWLRSALSDSREPVAIAAPVGLAFLRLSCNPSATRSPLSFAEASRTICSWFDLGAILVEPTLDVYRFAGELIEQVQGGTNLVTDAFLAALAISNRATIYSSDRDFSRFPGLKLVNPLAP